VKAVSSIPLVNLPRQYAALKAEIDAAMAGVVARQEFVAGRTVAAFAAEWLAALGAAHGAACSNGTAAISLALKALGVGPGDEVVTTAHTFFATVEAICAVGATPVFADIDPGSYTLDIDTAPVTARTRAVLPVHLYGTAADMDAIAACAGTHALKVIEDAAQAHLATWNDRALGTLGDAGTFSFYPGKSLGAYGDAGFVVARDAAVAATIAKLANHGRESKYTHDLIGENNRMDELQAAVLRVKLRHLPAWTEIRRSRARLYDSRLVPAGFKVIRPHRKAASVYHLYVVEVSNRDRTLAHLHAAGIGAGVHYPVPLHLQPALAHLGVRPGALPRTEAAADRVLSLPLCADITEDEVHRVCDTFLACARP
jgi:dTDP-4-amino-4,6-dideoxygalactose transaminase